MGGFGAWVDLVDFPMDTDTMEPGSPPSTPPTSARASRAALPPNVLLLTGGTGFLGQSIVHNCLRDEATFTKIFLLVRAKRGVSVSERATKLLDDWGALFGEACVRRKIVLVSATMEGDELGIEAAALQQIEAETTHVIHAAASVRFDEPAAVALNVNVTLARRVVSLAVRCRMLRHHIHVSTAYVNPQATSPRELGLVPLPPGVDTEALPLDSEADSAGDAAAALYRLHPGHHVNTYTWSKCIAEHVVSRCAKQNGHQFTIFRPSVIGPAWELPAPGARPGRLPRRQFHVA